MGLVWEKFWYHFCRFRVLFPKNPSFFSPDVGNIYTEIFMSILDTVFCTKACPVLSLAFFLVVREALKRDINTLIIQV